MLIPSPKVATYDLQPEMSAYEVTEKAVERIKSGEYGVMILNFANPDMVGHTGVLEAAEKAVRTVDECVGKMCIRDSPGTSATQPFIPLRRGALTIRPTAA